MEYDIVIGLEIHAELKTKTKAFCSCQNKFGSMINTNTCPVCLGMPGALPTINKQAVMYSIKSGLAFDCDINDVAIFERKNYYYPDLSKAYQISQLEKPICINGRVRYKIGSQEKVCRIDNIHMEEDAGKSIHAEELGCSLIDYNRCGVPLVEIVTKPDITSAEEAVEVLKSIKETLFSIGVSDCKMQEGSLRCDVNISLKPKGSTVLGTRTEMKNLNSFKAVNRAITYEVARQKQMLENGQKIVQETLKWDDNLGKNFSLRSKEASNDYRYFPDPDLLWVDIPRDYVKQIKDSIKELPYDKKNRYSTQLGLPDYDIEVLTLNDEIANYFDECLKYLNKPKVVSNWVMGDILRKQKENINGEITLNISAKDFTDLIKMVENNELSINSAKQVFEEMWETKKPAKQIAMDLGLLQVNDENGVEKYVDEVLASNPKAISDYKNGNERTLTFIVGQVMKLSRGKANPQIVNKMVKEKLSK